FKLGIFNEDLGVVNVCARHPDEVEAATATAFDKARSGGGPSVLVCEVDRLCSHTSSDDHRVYREPRELSDMLERDPILVLANELIEAGEISRDEWESAQAAIDRQVDEDYLRAEEAADPLAEEVLDELFGPLPEAEEPPIQGGQRVRICDAINGVFKEALETDDRYVFFGEDIEDPKGGVFRLTSGLSTAHPDRVFNSPLAEATIAGVACGIAAYGMRPVFELQFVDFVGPGWNQISQNLSTIRWRSGGAWKCPAVIYAPYGAYLPGGSIWHSQANESLFAHIPGLRVVVPSTPEDSAGLMWTALHAEDPTIFLIPKHLMRQQMQVDSHVGPVPFGKARIRQEGSDVTLVAWGNCVELAIAAAAQMADQVSVEIIDLRSIQPWDRESVAASLAKTGRLVVVQEDGESCSVGQMIISEMAGHEESWYSFVSAPQLVSKPDVHIGYNPILEYGALPSVDEIKDAIQATMDE
ncbi:MAG: transketolase C-terminal domain-containing protein, partial [Planctomycetota bacterium]